MRNASPFTAALRIGEVAISKDQLARRIGVPISRYERAKAGVGSYAQVDLPDSDDPWKTISQFVLEIGPRILELKANGEIGVPTLDLAFGVDPDSSAPTITLPSLICKAAGLHKIDIDVSIYPVSDVEATA